MKEVINDFYVFHEGEEAEKAIARMRKAMGKKNETAAAVKFAHTMLDLYGERMDVKNKEIQSRMALLNAYYKVCSVQNEINNAAHYASTLAGKIYNEYRAQGGDHYEEEAYRTGETREEVMARACNKKYIPSVSTHDKTPEEAEAAANT
jgi:hypothetical protein